MSREQSLFDKAEKLTTWDGYVYLALLESCGNQGFFHTVDSLQEAILEEIDDGEIAKEDIPTYCWACSSEGMREVSAEEIIEDSVEDMYEDAIYAVSENSKEKLQQALNSFYEANKHIVSYTPDYSKAVLLTWYGDYSAEDSKKNQQTKLVCPECKGTGFVDQDTGWSVDVARAYEAGGYVNAVECGCMDNEEDD